MAALLALAACTAQIAGGGWRGSLRLDAGERAQMVVDLAPAADTGREDGEGGWEAVLEAGGIRVRLLLTPMANCD
jgi:hypothetical protein